jgi:hypothetical protein
MRLLSLLWHAKPAPDILPTFVREIEDVRGVRVIRLQGPVGKEIGEEAREIDEAAARTDGVFARPLLFDFAGTSGWDFATVSYLVLALKRRLTAHARVGIIHPSPPLVAELQLAKLDALFLVFASEEEGIDELSKPQRAPVGPT